MKKSALIRCLVCCVLLCLLCGNTARADEEEHRDITAKCRFEVGPLTDRVAVLTDGNPQTAWTNDKSSNQYLQVYKPRGVATLSILWEVLPRSLSLRHGVDGQFTVLKYYEEADMPRETILLPEEAGVYYLCGSGGLNIAEVRVHTGDMRESFFPAHGYAPGPTAEWSASVYRRPLRRSDNGQQAWDMKETLIALGYPIEKQDRRFTEDAYMALVAFQSACGLYTSGVLDIATLQALKDPPPQAAYRTPAVAALLPRTSSELVKYARSKVGLGYVYGAAGAICTPSFRAGMKDLYPQYKDLISNFAYVWDGMEVYDCIGLFKAFLVASNGEVPKTWLTNVNGAVNRWLTKPEPLATMPNEPGIVLLQQNATNSAFMHVGLYVGDGLSVHARGHRYGVVVDQMPQLWTHWSRPIWLEYDTPAEPQVEWPPFMGEGERALVDTSSGNALNLYRRPFEARKYFTGVRIPNYSEVTIQGIPINAPYWRIVTVPDSNGLMRTGYVYAKDLTVLDAPKLPDQ